MAPLKDDTVALFRKECAKMMASAPPQYRESGVVPQLVSSMERAAGGQNELIQLYQGGTKYWMIKARGETKYFPRAIAPPTPAPRKRVRDESVIIEHPEEEDDLDQNYRDETPLGPAVKRARAKKASRAADNVDQVTPLPTGRTTANLPSAPKKKKKRAPSSTSSRSAPIEASYITVEEQLGRGKRRCVGRDADDSAILVKEEPIDDLASLCGRVNGLEFMSSTGEPDSEDEFGGRTTPIASTSRLRLTADALATIV